MTLGLLESGTIVPSEVAVLCLQFQIDDCRHEDEKSSLVESLNYLVDSLKKFIDNIEG